jgi:hypothetical protein
MEAGTDADLIDWIDTNTLLARWPELYPPPYVRGA